MEAKIKSNSHQNRHITLKSIVEHHVFSRFIVACILINAITVGLETYPTILQSYGEIFEVADHIFLTIFTVEILLKIGVYRASFFKSGWNLLDFIVVALSLILISSNTVSVIRIVRVLRILRTLSAFPSLRRVVNALFMSIPAMSSTLTLMIILFYIYGIVGTTFFSAVAPDYFGSLHLTMLTLFQLFTVDSWASGIYRPNFPMSFGSIAYFVSFIIISVFIVANLFFGELVNNAQKLSKIEEEKKEIAKVELQDVQQELHNMRIQNEELHEKIDNLTSLIQQKNHIC